MTLDVPGYEPRRVSVEFRGSNPRSARVYADGPRESPHRYGKNLLCIWYPSDDDDQRWVPEDGLLALLGMTSMHLFKEAYWRETGGYEGGEWLGQEAPHGIAQRDAEADESLGEDERPVPALNRTIDPRSRRRFG